MKLSTYLDLPDAPYEFHTFRKKLVAWGLQVIYDESADPNYIVKQRVEDLEFRKKLNFAIKSGVSRKILNLNGVIVNRATNDIVCFGYETSSEVVPAVDLLKQRNGEYSKKTLTEEEALALLPKGLGTFPYITPNALAALTNDDVREYQQMYDGVMIRLYYDHESDKWRVGTGRATDASKSIWSCGKSFYDLFMNTGYWQKIMDSPGLNKSHCYMFIMCHPENQQVHKHNYVKMFHIFTRSMETMEELDVDLGFQKMPRFTGVIEKPIDALSLMKDSSDTNMGIMIILKNGTRIPIMSHEYNCILRLRGNYANLRCRVIELVQSGTNSMEEAFVKNYPNFKNYFEQVKKAYVGMIRGLFDKTVYYKIRKNRVPPGVMSPDEISMMNSIWYNHIRDKQKAFELQEKEKNTNSAGPATNAANATSTTINGVTMVPVVPDATRQTNDSEKQASNNNNKRLTIEYVRDYIKRLPTYKLWELLNEKPEVSKLEDW